jgi:hypothetical protein
MVPVIDVTWLGLESFVVEVLVVQNPIKHRMLHDWALRGAGHVFSLAVVIFFIAIIFRLLPNVRVPFSRSRTALPEPIS